MILQKADVLLMEEPTTHLDLESIVAINNALIEFEGSIIFSSNDREFANSTSNRRLILKN